VILGEVVATRRRHGLSLALRSVVVRRLWPDPVDDVDIDATIAADVRRAPPDRPWLLVNMITSLDGAITIDGRSGGLGGPADKAAFAALRAVADVVLAGAGTVRAESYGPVRPTASQRADRVARGQAEVPPLAVVTRSMELDLSTRLFTDGEVRPIVVTCASAPPERVAAAREVADVVVTGDKTVDLPAALVALAERGAGVITCEGGPSLNGDLVADDLVDEWAHTLSPLLTAGQAARAAVGPTPPAPRAMTLDRLLEGDGLLLSRWLRAR
jgi:riboflavin biosynthesis pyrimidine reductase